MPKLLITGQGHSGTNLVLGLVRAINYYLFYPNDGKHTEDRKIKRILRK